MRTAVVAVLFALLLQGCGSAASDRGVDGPSSSSGRYKTTALVLESREHGPELCLGGVAESYPPQCSGLPITNWDWSRVGGEERVAGTTWGEYEVAGTFDGTSFTVTGVRPARSSGDPSADRIETACEEPAGGWQVRDATRISEQRLERAIAVARSQPDLAGVWIDYVREPARGGTGEPENVILNVAFTSDLDRHESELAAHWGGPLCVVERDRTLRELRGIQDELTDRKVLDELGLQVLYVSVSEHENVVDLLVVAADERTREALDEHYGEGAVRVSAALRRID